MQVVKESQSFQRVVVSRDEALAMFQENKFKVEIISGLPQSATISLYRSVVTAQQGDVPCTLSAWVVAHAKSKFACAHPCTPEMLRVWQSAI